VRVRSIEANIYRGAGLLSTPLVVTGSVEWFAVKKNFPHASEKARAVGGNSRASLKSHDVR
jgi:hypothetical protein